MKSLKPIELQDNKGTPKKLAHTHVLSTHEFTYTQLETITHPRRA